MPESKVYPPLLEPRDIAVAAYMAAGPIQDVEVYNDEGDVVGYEPDFDGWSQKVEQAATAIAADSVYHLSGIRQAIEAVALAQGETGKAWDCIIESVSKNPKTNRADVVVRGWPSKDYPDGRQNLRTDITPGNNRAKALAKRLRSLEDHKVRIFVHKETMKGGANEGRDWNIIKGVLDLGPGSDTDFVPFNQK